MRLIQKWVLMPTCRNADNGGRKNAAIIFIMNIVFPYLGGIFLMEINGR